MDRRSWLAGCVGTLFGMAMPKADVLIATLRPDKVQDDDDLESVVTYAGFIPITASGKITRVEWSNLEGPNVTRVYRTKNGPKSCILYCWRIMLPRSVSSMPSVAALLRHPVPGLTVTKTASAG